MKIYLRNKLIALFMLVSIVPLALIGWMAFQRTTVIIESLQYEKLETLAEKRADRINELITERQRDVSLLAQFPEMPHTVDQFTQAFANGGVDSPAYQELNRKHGAYLSTYAASLGIIDLFMITPAA